MFIIVFPKNHERGLWELVDDWYRDYDVSCDPISLTVRMYTTLLRPLPLFGKELSNFDHMANNIIHAFTVLQINERDVGYFLQGNQLGFRVHKPLEFDPVPPGMYS